ncbi:MAG: TetR/AcrR family transcriptional regulator [Chloroflexi bacterium]|nr:TetR/AcrR family transcriptional regulator [Chloroflexota bacterium]
MPRTADPDLQKERREQILAAAQVVFAEHGFADAPMVTIAKQAGVSKGTVYLYFASKDDLIAALLDDFLAESLTYLHMLVEQKEVRVRDRLTAYAEAVSTQMAADSSMLSIAYEFYALAARNPAVRMALQTYFSAYGQALETLLLQGVDSGEVAAGTDVAAAAVMLVALLEGVTLLWFTDPDAVDITAMLPAALRQFLNSL